MVDRSLVTSGFDVEVLLSPRWFAYALLAQVEAGLLPLAFDLPVPRGRDLFVALHPPEDLVRSYSLHPMAALPQGFPGSFTASLAAPEGGGVQLMLAVRTTLTDPDDDWELDGWLDLELGLTLVAQHDTRSCEHAHRLELELVGLAGPLAGRLESEGIAPGLLRAAIGSRLPTSVPFGFAGGRVVQRARLRPLPGDADHDPAVGLYVELALRRRPGLPLAPRGDVTLAGNFLDAGQDFALSTRPQLLGALGTDLLMRLAESGGADSEDRYVLRREPGNLASTVVGDIDGIAVGARPAASSVPAAGLDGSASADGSGSGGGSGSANRSGAGDGPGAPGHLAVDVRGTFVVSPLDERPFQLTVTLTPVVEGGALRWATAIVLGGDVTGSTAGFVPVVTSTALLGPSTGARLFELLVADRVVVDPLATALSAERSVELDDASFLDLLSPRTTVAERRWDPFYASRHEVVAHLDALELDADGVSISGRATLGRRPAPVAHTVIRDEQRDAAGEIRALLYRVADLDAIAEDLVAVAPGTDRLSWTRAEGPASERLVALTPEQLDERIETGRLFHPVLYVVQKISLAEDTIDQLLLLSDREVREARDRLLAEARDRAADHVGTALGPSVEAAARKRLLAATGTAPDAAELANAVARELASAVDAEVAHYEADLLPIELRGAIDRMLRFDAAPRELARLQDRGAIVVAGREVLTTARGVLAAGDHPDPFRWDNLLALDRYRSPYRPPR